MPEPYRVVSALPTGTAVSRFIIAKAFGRGDYWTQLNTAERWRDTPQVKASLELQTKIAVPAGSTTDATWAGPLAAHGIAAEALTIMRGMSILGALEAQMQNVPLHVQLARETGAGITGGWVAAGGAIPVQATPFATVVEEHFKYGVIVPMSEELVNLSTPPAEATVRRTVLGGCRPSLYQPASIPRRSRMAVPKSPRPARQRRKSAPREILTAQLIADHAR